MLPFSTRDAHLCATVLYICSLVLASMSFQLHLYICSFVFLRVYLCVSSPIAKMVINTCAYLLNTSHFVARSLSPRVQLVVCSSLRCLSTRFCEPRRLVIICLQHLPDFVHLAGDLVGAQFHSHSLSFVFLKLRLSDSCIL